MICTVCVRVCVFVCTHVLVCACVCALGALCAVCMSNSLEGKWLKATMGSFSHSVLTS